jgi:surface polysaccharide O-acyltransferase-like enzyme
VKVTVPLPTFGFSGLYALTDKLVLGGRLGIFAIELDLDRSNIGGSVIDAQLSLFHQTFKYVGFGIGGNFLKSRWTTKTKTWMLTLITNTLAQRYL